MLLIVDSVLIVADASDNLGVRTLGASSFASGTTMTTESCIAFCDAKSFVYAGTEYSVRLIPDFSGKC